MNNASELKQKAIEMTTQLLERKGYRIIDRLSGECISLVAADDGDIVFARVIARDAKEKGVSRLDHGPEDGGERCHRLAQAAGRIDSR